ncbi:MAG: DNA helicase RecQ [Hespellia sp.]|nr:DNA helicase RecQ [Hespellia sp.]
MTNNEQIMNTLKHYFGYEELRGGQAPLMNAVLEGRDVLGIMPTGAGKSLCFQIPALIMEGITLVISPLISLMKDQVSALNQAGVHAAFLNSSLSAVQYQKALELARMGKYKIIYVAPERLETESFLRFATDPAVRISFLAVDEAHCVSQWGQDFRPSYLKILTFLERLSYRPVLGAYTATATLDVREDILDILMLQNPEIVLTGFDRDNLFYAVKKPVDKKRELISYVKKKEAEMPGISGIIYCISRKLVEEVCYDLRTAGFSVTRYHAGLSDTERRENQEDFIYDRKQIMVATNAFGMGIDKSDVRYVVHYNMPKNMESYYQEAGRAGRDGEPSECILYYEPRDVRTNQFFIDHNEDNQELSDAERQMIQERDRERLRQMTFYCFTNECLRHYILNYFGEKSTGYCGNCLNCLTEYEEVAIDEEAGAILRCIRANSWNYGVSIIVDILRGAKNQKILGKHLDQNPMYGKLEAVTVPRLRQIIQELVLQEYLVQTDEQYPVLKLEQKGKDYLESPNEIRMKLAKERAEEKAEKKTVKKSKRAKSVVASLSEADEKIFEKLRAIRWEIAQKEHVPPYLVFSDKTLALISSEKPKNREEMLKISGVGEVKWEKYGEQFLVKEDIK